MELSHRHYFTVQHSGTTTSCLLYQANRQKTRNSTHVTWTNTVSKLVVIMDITITCSIVWVLCFVSAPLWWKDMKQLTQYFSAHSTHTYKVDENIGKNWACRKWQQYLGDIRHNNYPTTVAFILSHWPHPKAPRLSDCWTLGVSFFL